MTDLRVLSELASFVDEEDLYATDYLSDSGVEGSLCAALERSGRLRFSLREPERQLRIASEYVARRQLDSAELQFLREYTLGQWSDGMGECLFVPDGPYQDFKLQALDNHDVAIADYPYVEFTESDLSNGA